MRGADVLAMPCHANCDLRKLASCAICACMTLADYLAEPENSATALARECNVAVSTITRAAATGNASAELMRLIFQKTGGRVTPNGIVGVAA